MRGVSLMAVMAATVAAAVWGGERPYEMVIAKRTADDHPPLLPMTSSAGWKIETSNSDALVTTSDDVLLFGNGVIKIVHHATGANPVIRLSPPEPVKITNYFDAVSCWIYGNNHSYAPDPKTPPVSVFAHFADSDGKPFTVQLAKVSFKEWFLCHKRLSPELISRVAKGSEFRYFSITGGRNTEDRTIYFNSLAVFTETFNPLKIPPRPQRAFALFPEIQSGLNTGTDRLPFPNSILTVIPPDPAQSICRIARGESGRYYLVRDGEDGKLEIALPSKAANWDDMFFRWNGSRWYAMALDGGIYFAPNGDHQKIFRPENEQVEITTDNLAVIYRGTLADHGKTLGEIFLKFHLEGKSLTADLKCTGGNVEEIRFGHLLNLNQPLIIPVPYYSYHFPGHSNRPCVVATAIGGSPFFAMYHMDWTQSNASKPFTVPNQRLDGTVASNGGTRYLPKTDGKRNDCTERFVYSFAPEFDQVLPNIPNPPSPWKSKTGTHVWVSHPAYDRDHSAEFWRNRKRLGIANMAIVDHENLWRDNNESFTFRTFTAPKRGGDASEKKYVDILQNELGYLCGPYNNFTDFAPVNGYWNYNLISRTPDNQLQHAWERCYAPKPAYAVAYCERLTPVIQNKFHFTTAYCDVHSCVAPWERTDYDWRVPGGGTFAGVFYPFGEIMLLQKKNWNGPVYSEGGSHFMYCGLTDGNYAQDQSYDISVRPWLVDFDLLRMHPLCCNFGIGNMDMFMPGQRDKQSSQNAADRFLAATAAFGHPGFLLGGLSELPSYFLLQGIASYYTQADVESIRYLDQSGNPHPTTAAIANRCFRRSQLCVKYNDGTGVIANGNERDAITVTWNGHQTLLPPNSFYARSGDGQAGAFSGEWNGHRAELAVSKDYTYVNGRGQLALFPEGGCDGIMVRLPEKSGTEEVIVYKTWGVASPKDILLPYAATNAVALNMQSEVIGPAKIEHANGYTRVFPVADAVSYRLWPKDPIRRSTFPEMQIQPTAVTNAAVESLEFPDSFIAAYAYRGQDEVELDSQTSGAQGYAAARSCGGVSHYGYFIHPPYFKGTGYTLLKFAIELPESPLEFSCLVGKVDGSDLGDGILTQVLVETADGTRKKVAEQLVTEHKWYPLSVDLSPWKGQHIRLVICSDAGRSNDSTGDWSAWANLSLKPKK